MKFLALMVTLALHLTGLWPHVQANTRSRLAAAVSTGSLRPQPVPVSLWTGPLPTRTGSDPLHVDAVSAIAVDLGTGTTLYEQNASATRPIASITKLATSLVALSRHQPTDEMKIPTLPVYNPDDSLVGLRPGETYSIGDLVRAALINSGDDAADALALGDTGSETKFVDEMNAKMSTWGIAGVHFSNPSGLKDQDNYATADSVAKIAELALTSSFIRQTISQQQATITSTDGHTIDLNTTDNLLASGQFYGIKTGYTPAAGECFVGLTRIDGHEVVTVVLGAGDRFAATQTMANWISRNWQWL